MNHHVFRAYDIRGEAERDLESSFCEQLGRAIATVAARDGNRCIALGRDARHSGPRIRDALVHGLTTSGVDVVDLGVVPTPVTYFAAHHFELGSHVMITGSHNPSGDNGFKIGIGGRSLHGAGITALRDLMEAQDFIPQSSGSVDCRDAIGPYLKFCGDNLDLGPRRVTAVLDAGNGAGGPTAVALYRQLGIELGQLYCDPDGDFPNHHPDPTVEANLADLRTAVADSDAEVGLALDGDADRLGVIDRHGRILWGDQLMILFARALLAHKPGAQFIADVKCSQTLFESIEAAGGRAIMWKTGHSFVKEKLKETGADLAGEMSGHLFFADRYLGYDDGIYAGARLIELLSHSEVPLEELYDGLPSTLNTPEMRFDCPDQIKFEVVKRATDILRNSSDVHRVIDIDGARALVDGGWGLVRASNTGPLLVVRCEAQDQSRLDAISALMERAIAEARASVAS